MKVLDIIKPRHELNEYSIMPAVEKGAEIAGKIGGKLKGVARPVIGYSKVETKFINTWSDAYAQAWKDATAMGKPVPTFDEWFSQFLRPGTPLADSSFAKDPSIIDALKDQAVKKVKQLNGDIDKNFAELPQKGPHGVLRPVTWTAEAALKHWQGTIWAGSIIGESLWPKFQTYDKHITDINNQIAKGVTPKDVEGGKKESKKEDLLHWAKEEKLVADKTFQVQISAVIATEVVLAGAFVCTKFIRVIAEFFKARGISAQVLGPNGVKLPVWEAIEKWLLLPAEFGIAQFMVTQINIRGDNTNEIPAKGNTGLPKLIIDTIWDENNHYVGLPYTTILGLIPGIAGQSILDSGDAIATRLDKVYAWYKKTFPNKPKEETPLEKLEREERERKAKEEEDRKRKEEEDKKNKPPVPPEPGGGQTTTPPDGPEPAPGGGKKIQWGKNPGQPPGTDPEIWVWGTDNSIDNPPPKEPPAGCTFGTADHMFIKVPKGTNPNK
jgi:hypothetical protein